MQRKFLSLLAVSLVIVMLIPSVPILAYSGFQVGTYDTLESLVSDTENVQNIYNINTSFFDSWTQEDYEAYFSLSGMPFNPFTNDSLWVLGTGNSVGVVTLWCMDLSQVGVPDWSCFTVSTGFSIAAFYNSAPEVTTVPIYIYLYYPASNSWVKYTQSSVSLINGTFMSYVLNPDTGLREPDSSVTKSTYSFQWSAGVTTPFLWGNIDHVFCYKYWEAHESVNFSNISLSTIPNQFPSFMYANSGDSGTGYFDFFNHGNILYYNGEDFIDGGAGDLVEESNENHMYFQRCNFGFAEPSNVNHFGSFGGAYFYVDYSVDNWVRDHISDYQIKFHAEVYVGTDHYSFTKRYEIDPDNYITVPFSLFDGWSNPGFSTLITNRKIDNNFLKTYLYSVAPSSYTSFYNSVSTGSFNSSVSSALQQMLNNYSDEAGLLTYTNNSFTRVINSSVLTNEFIDSVFYNNTFQFNVSAVLIDTSGNESGVVSRSFDIVRGSDTATDNSGLVNDNPYESDTDEEDYLPYVPSGSDLVSSTGSGSYIQNNIQIPSDYTVTYRDGVDSFIDFYNKDTEVSGIQNTFWGSLGIFKGNPATDLYEEYWGFLPDGFKSVIIGCASIGIIGAAATILRKRMLR